MSEITNQNKKTKPNGLQENLGLTQLAFEKMVPALTIGMGAYFSTVWVGVAGAVVLGGASLWGAVRHAKKSAVGELEDFSFRKTPLPMPLTEKFPEAEYESIDLSKIDFVEVPRNCKEKGSVLTRAQRVKAFIYSKPRLNGLLGDNGRARTRRHIMGAVAIRLGLYGTGVLMGKGMEDYAAPFVEQKTQQIQEYIERVAQDSGPALDR